MPSKCKVCKTGDATRHALDGTYDYSKVLCSRCCAPGTAWVGSSVSSKPWQTTLEGVKSANPGQSIEWWNARTAEIIRSRGHVGQHRAAADQQAAQQVAAQKLQRHSRRHSRWHSRWPSRWQQHDRRRLSRWQRPNRRPSRWQWQRRQRRPSRGQGGGSAGQAEGGGSAGAQGVFLTLNKALFHVKEKQSILPC